MKKLLKISLLLLTIATSLASCNSTIKFIEKGYSYDLIDEPARLHKVWLPKYVKYRKKQKRYRFVNGHYRIVLGGRAWTYRQVRQRNWYGNL